MLNFQYFWLLTYGEKRLDKRSDLQKGTLLATVQVDGRVQYPPYHKRKCIIEGVQSRRNSPILILANTYSFIIEWADYCLTSTKYRERVMIGDTGLEPLRSVLLHRLLNFLSQNCLS